MNRPVYAAGIKQLLQKMLRDAETVGLILLGIGLTIAVPTVAAGGRPKNADVRTREYLTPAEVEAMLRTSTRRSSAF